MALFPDTAQQIVTGVRVLLRRPSDIKLPDDDILEVINDLCKEYVQEESLSIRDRSSVVQTVTIAPLDPPDADFSIALPDVADYEPQKLEYASIAGPLFAWSEAVVVPLEAWPRHFGKNYAAVAFYGSSATQTPWKVKLNLLDSEVDNLQFRLTYRIPLLTVIQIGDKPPIPSAHMPMLKREAAIRCASIVKDDSAEWIAWLERTLPLYVNVLAGQKRNWRDYLTSSVEPQIQPIERSDRANQARFISPYIPPQP